MKLQFSLRALLIFAVLAAIGCAWIGLEYERARVEQGALAKLTPMEIQGPPIAGDLRFAHAF